MRETTRHKDVKIMILEKEISILDSKIEKLKQQIRDGGEIPVTEEEN